MSIEGVRLLLGYAAGSQAVARTTQAVARRRLQAAAWASRCASSTPILTPCPARPASAGPQSQLSPSTSGGNRCQRMGKGSSY